VSRVAIVTGAASGIGLAASLTLLDDDPELALAASLTLLDDDPELALAAVDLAEMTSALRRKLAAWREPFPEGPLG
jgi:NAD(P)-dependent dehydrogenase (short-subunit alcohol dehydrogenase family)